VSNDQPAATSYPVCPDCGAVEWGNATCSTCRSHWPGGDPLAATRCEYVLPQVGVLRELGPRRCALDEGHDGEHLFDFPKITSAAQDCWCEIVNGRRHHADGCPKHDRRPA